MAETTSFFSAIELYEYVGCPASGEERRDEYCYVIESNMAEL